MLSYVVLLLAATMVPGQMEPSSEPVAKPFEAGLGEYQNLTWEQLDSRLARRPQEISRIDSDPASADFMELVQRELGLAVEDIEKLSSHGLVLVDPQVEQSFPGAYYRLYARDVPLLITTDSILHAFHHSYDKMLVDLETNVFAPRLEQLLADVHAGLMQNVAESSRPELVECYRDVDLYLTIAQNLLLGSSPNRPQVRSAMNQDAVVNEILGVILQPQGAGVKPARLYGGERLIDFTQFRPRGHYTKTPLLKQYFRCMMWLGRADCGWNILPTDSTTGVMSTGVRELRGGVLLVKLLESTNCLQVWKEIDDLLSFLVGHSDDVNVTQLLPLLEKYQVQNSSDLLDMTKLGQLETAIRKSAPSAQRIRSQVLFNRAGAATPVHPPTVFQLFGQRFALDSFVLSQVVHDAIVFHGEPMRRMMPTGLDVMAGLGNDLAVRLLEPELRRWNYAGNLAALRAMIRETPGEYWQDHVYGGWLNALRELDRDLTGEMALPKVFRTEAWRRKQLQTQLASWSELRHDTILYAKASYSVPECEVPVAYVEPYPQFYGGLSQLARNAAGKLKSLPQKQVTRQYGRFRGGLPKDGSYSDFFLRMAGHLEMLQVIAQKEMLGKPFSAEEKRFLETTISQRGNVLFMSGALKVLTYDGWYPQLMYNFGEEKQDAWRATLADVHTDSQGGQVLEVGVGRVNYCVAVIDQKDRPCVFVGPVYSYYEFPHAANDRLTDEQWQTMLRQDLPSRPSFILPLVGGADANMEPVVQTVRRGNTLTITVDPRSRRAGTPGRHRVEISGEGLQTLANVAPGVRCLDLSDCPIADAELQYVKPLYNLKAVDLSGTQLKGHGLTHLGGSRFLRRLALKNTAIPDETLSALTKWPYLEVLDLRDTGITDHGIRQLVTHRYLRQLMLEGTRVTSAGITAIQKALPQCQVTHSKEDDGQHP
jgi:hypothetical protein